MPLIGQINVEACRLEPDEYLAGVCLVDNIESAEHG